MPIRIATRALDAFAPGKSLRDTEIRPTNWSPKRSLHDSSALSAWIDEI